MNKGINLSVVLILLLLFFSFSCKTIIEYPIGPHVEFKNFATYQPNGYDSLGFLTIGFTDGDGDIGDVNAPDQENLFINLYERINGELEPIILPDSTVTFNAIIPDLTPKGKYKGIKGDIEITFPLYYMIPFFQSDTIAFQVYLVDRAGHKSNVIMTPQFIVY